MREPAWRLYGAPAAESFATQAAPFAAFPYFRELAIAAYTLGAFSNH